MKCLFLCAGYATRLYPLTENFPKPLLKVKDKPILNWLIEDIEKSNKIDEYVVVSNAKFAHHFNAWAKTLPYKITVVDDGTYSNETRLGAVKDIEFAQKALNLDSDMLVLAGDNVLDFSLCSFIDYALEKNASCVLRYFEKDTEKLKKSGVLLLGDNNVVLEMEEKPREPKTNWCCPPFYYYKREDAKKISKAIESGCNTDAPGSFISWLSKNSTVFAMEMPGKRYDIGNIDSFSKVQTEYKGITR